MTDRKYIGVCSDLPKMQFSRPWVAINPWPGSIVSSFATGDTVHVVRTSYNSLGTHIAHVDATGRGYRSGDDPLHRVPMGILQEVAQ
jgi:hypothetical protein